MYFSQIVWSLEKDEWQMMSEAEKTSFLDIARKKKPPQRIRSWGKGPFDRLRAMIKNWLRGSDLNGRPQGYEPCELPGCSTPHDSIAVGPTDYNVRREG